MRKMDIAIVVVILAFTIIIGALMVPESKLHEYNFNTTSSIAKDNVVWSYTAQPAIITPSCSNSGYISALIDKAKENQTYVIHQYDCTQFSHALGEVLLAEGCEFRLVTGWYGENGTARAWHRWVETPYFQIEPQLGIITPGAQSLYSKSYATYWNFNHEYG